MTDDFTLFIINFVESNIKTSDITTLMKHIFVIGDVELGAGNKTDDFIADKVLSRLISSWSVHKNADLVLNGDTFDFLKCPYTLPAQYTRHVTAEIAVKKLHLVIKAHPLVFRALKKFAKNNMIYFIRGNHDLELAFPAVQQELRLYLKNVWFPGLQYVFQDVYVEHGQQYDPANWMHPRRLFAYLGGKRILNNTFSSFTVIGALIPLKEEHPFLERIKPWPLMMRFHAPIGKKVNRTIFFYFLKSVFYYPLRYYADPTHQFPRQFIGEFVRRVRSWNWDLADYLPIFKKKNRPQKVIVLGHIHESLIEKNKHRVIIRPGAWRDEYLLYSSGVVEPIRKQYVHITVGKKTRWKVEELPRYRTSLNFYEIVRDEQKVLTAAIEEERTVK